MSKPGLLAPVLTGQKATRPVLGHLLAHVCPRAQANDFEYVLLGEHWFLITWGQMEKIASKTTWIVQSRPAVVSHCCAEVLDENAPSVPYKGGIPMVDDAIAMLQKRAQ